MKKSEVLSMNKMLHQDTPVNLEICIPENMQMFDR